MVFGNRKEYAMSKLKEVKPKQWLLPVDELPREAYEFLCDCGKVASKVDCTKEERKEFGCSREDARSTYSCCSRAFVCTSCKKRYVFRAPPPEVEW